MGLLRARAAVGQVPEHLGDPGPVRVGESDQAGQDEHRQRNGEVGDQVGRAPLAEPVDEAVRQLLAVPAEFEVLDLFERLPDHRGVASVLGMRR